MADQLSVPQAARLGAPHHPAPGSAAPSRWWAVLKPSKRPAHALLRVFLLAGLVTSMAAAAAPALEYGPEVEARFLESCATGRDQGQCRCLLEGMQRLVGVTLFHEIAEGGPAGLSASADARVSAAMLRTAAHCAGQVMRRDTVASR